MLDRLTAVLSQYPQIKLESAPLRSPQTMGEVHQLGTLSSNTCEQLEKSIGFRNIAVHNDVAINWEIVYEICQKSVQDFRQFAQEISRYAGL